MKTFATAGQIYHQHNDQQEGGKALRWAQIGFVLLVLCLLIFFRNAPQFNTMGITFISIVLEAFPFMLIGTLVGGCIEVFLPQEKITRWLPQGRFTTVFMAAGLGILFPVCECAIVPVVRRLLNKGVPLSAAIAFLLGGPIVNPVAAASTSVAYFFDWSIVVNRLAFGYLIAIAAGLLMETFFTKTRAIRSDTSEHQKYSAFADLARSGTNIRLREKITLAVRHAANDFFDIGRFLVIGAFLAASVQALAPRYLFSSIASTPASSILIMMVMAVVLNLCSEADAFVAASFQWTLVPVSAQLAFMILGPMLDIKLLLMYGRIFRNRAIIALSSITFLLVFLSMIFRDVVFK
ncbi:MAG: permease [Desulfobacterales bacterium]|jgi:uncharacterized membrane protein YraQ (UPF0718 family)